MNLPTCTRGVMTGLLNDWIIHLSTLGEFKNGAGTASSPSFVSSKALCGDEPSPPLFAHFLELTLLSTNPKIHQSIPVP